MTNWFECKVRYTKIDEKTGREKKVTETYLVDAVSFTEAEERIYREMEAYISGEFTVTNIRRANYTDIFPNEDGDRWYKCKVTFMSIDESAGKEKKVANMMLVEANDVEDASERIKQGLDGMTVDFEIVSISVSEVVDFFAYYQGQEVGAKGAFLRQEGKLTEKRLIVTSREYIDELEEEDNV